MRALLALPSTYVLFLQTRIRTDDVLAGNVGMLLCINLDCMSGVEPLGELIRQQSPRLTSRLNVADTGNAWPPDHDDAIEAPSDRLSLS